ncbi:MAG TPA: alpha/beta fold hydrolase [Candidatus Limnocylindrales bacterium]|nr:alpha/beta fold hydrolase [Candidatus Limnocylindrales bacterium]
MRLHDGRDLEVLSDEPANGLPLLFHSGTPTAAMLYPPLVKLARERGLRTVTYSRPGYAASTPQPGRSVANAAADTAAILDGLGATEFVTIGWSGGGPHALACAALLPERCRAAATIAGVAPYPAEGIDWLDGMGPENVEEFSLALEGQAALVPWLEDQAKVLAAVEAQDVAASLGGLVSPVDQAAVTGEFAEYLAATFRRSVAAGVAGWRDDDLAFTRTWGFDLAAISRPVSIWQGGEDRMVPFAHGEWLARHIPTARVHLDRKEGHLSLAVAALDRILDELVAAGVRTGG